MKVILVAALIWQIILNKITLILTVITPYLSLRWWCTPPRLWSCRWRGKVSTWRWVSTSSSSVRPSPGWSGTPSPWPLPPRRTTSAPTSVSLETGLRRCTRPAEETKLSPRRPGNCPSTTTEEGCDKRGKLCLKLLVITFDCILLLPDPALLWKTANGGHIKSPEWFIVCVCNRQRNCRNHTTLTILSSHYNIFQQWSCWASRSIFLFSSHQAVKERAAASELHLDCVVHIKTHFHYSGAVVVVVLRLHPTMLQQNICISKKNMQLKWEKNTK